MVGACHVRVACVLNRPFAIFAYTHTDYMAPLHTHTHTAIHLIDCGHVDCGVFMGAGSRVLESEVWCLGSEFQGVRHLGSTQ